MSEFQVNEDNCIKCGLCIKDCAVRALSMEEFPVINDELCFECGHCFAICPTGSISILGKTPSQGSLLKDNLPTPKQMEVLIKGRRSVRSYENENLPPSQIKELLNIVSHAPTAVNSRLVLHTLIEDKDVMESFRVKVYEGLEKYLANPNLEENHMTAILRFALKFRLEKSGDVLFRGAPHLLVTSSPKESISPQVNSHIALAYFELMANSMEIGTLWNGMITKLLSSIPHLKDLLGIPNDHVVGYSMSFGKSAVSYARTVEHNTPKMNMVDSII